MEHLKKTVEEMERVIGKKIVYTEERYAVKDGDHTYFTFVVKGKTYIGALEGTDAQVAALAALLPAHLEGGTDAQPTLSKTQFFKKVLTGESTTSLVYQYAKKYAVQDVACFVAVVETPKMAEEIALLSAQYGGNGMDMAVETDDGRVAVIRFCQKKEECFGISGNQ